jgi:predicted amidohydrolase YtcJ
MQIFENADFISCEDKNREFKILIENKGKIVFIGDEVPEKYQDAKRINLNGSCVVPGFADTHIHFESFALFHCGLDVRHVKDFKEMGECINEYILSNPKEKVILAFGCSAHTVSEKRLPDCEDLDKITSHPVMIVKYDGHASVANSAFIKKLPSSVTKQDGFDKNTGWFYYNAFYKVVNHITKSVSLVRVFKNMINGSDFLARKGISLIHTVEGVGFPFDIDIELMRIAALALPQHFKIYFQTMKVKKVLRRKFQCIGGCFATALDGCFGSEDAALLQPYANNPQNKGILYYNQDEVNEFVKKANRAGLQIAMHAIGDAAVEQLLTAYQVAHKDFPREDPRHIIIHADLLNREMIMRASDLNLYVALQTPFLYWEQEPMEYIESIIGDRASKMIPVKSLMKGGLTIASGSDGPTTIPDPILGIYAACNHPDPEESVSALDALKMHTNWAAKLSFDEKERGTLTENKIADFAVLDKNPLKIDTKDLRNLKVQDLYLAGKKYTGQSDSALKLLLRAIGRKYFL